MKKPSCRPLRTLLCAQGPRGSDAQRGAPCLPQVTATSPGCGLTLPDSLVRCESLGTEGNSGLVGMHSVARGDAILQPCCWGARRRDWSSEAYLQKLLLALFGGFVEGRDKLISFSSHPHLSGQMTAWRAATQANYQGLFINIPY